MIEKCTACGSRHLVRSLSGRINFPRWDIDAVAPGGPMGLGRSAGKLRAVACVDCGLVQWQVVDLEKLAAAYKEQQAGSLQLG